MKNPLNLCISFLFLVVLGCSCPGKLAELAKNADSSTPRPTFTPSATASPSVGPKGDYDLSMDKYDRLKVGMARAEVERILGGKGTEVSSSTGGGMRFSVNKWEGGNFRSIILSFKNDKILSKSQVGLK